MNISQKKMGVILSYATIFINVTVGFIYLPELLKILGKSQYGVYQLIGSMIAYIGLMDLGLLTTIVKYYSSYIALNDKEGQENILAISSIIYAFITVATLVIGFVIYLFLDEVFDKRLTLEELKLAKEMYVLLLINVSVTIPSNVFLAVIDSHEKFIFAKANLLLQTILRPVLTILIISQIPSAFILVVIQTLLNFLAIGLSAYYCFKKLKIKIKLHHWDKGMIRDMMQFSFYIFLGAMIDLIFWRADHIVLGAFVGTTAVTVYSVSSQIVMNYMYLSTTISNVLFPGIAKKVAEDASDYELTQVFIKVGRLQYYLLACALSGFILFGKTFMELWVGKDCIDAFYITLIILVPYTIDLIQNIGLAILKAKNMYSFRSKMFFVIAVSKILISIPLAMLFEGIGCAVASGVAYFIGNAIIMNIYYQKKVNIRIIDFWKEIGKITITVIGVMGLGISINQINPLGGWLDLIVNITFYMLVYIGFMWRFTMNVYEKSMVLGILSRFSFIRKRVENL